MFVWATLPDYIDTTDLLARALRANVAFVPGRAAYVDGRGGSEMRLNFSGSTDDSIREGVRRIGAVVQEQVGLYGTLTGAKPVPRPAATRRAATSRMADVLPLPARRRLRGRRHRAQFMTRVAVLKGGRSFERQVSLRSGARVEAALERLGHDVVGIDVGGDLVPRLREAAPEVAFLALHGPDGEDGTVQELLEVMGIRYTGSRVSACVRSADKVLAKHELRDAGVPDAGLRRLHADRLPRARRRRTRCPRSRSAWSSRSS